MLVPYDEALALALEGVSPVAVERLSLPEAEGRVLAEDVEAPYPLPPFSYSAMDGYAVRSGDFATGGPRWTLPVVSASRAGHPGPPLAPGGVARITTGGHLPEGADAVIIQENVERDGDRITTGAAPVAGQHVRAAGTDMARDTVALFAGTRLGPGQLGLLATLDQMHVLVRRTPIVTLLSTGDELRPPGSPGPVGSIPESNTFVLGSIARRAGATARRVPLVADDLDETARQVEAALQGTDLLVTIGGASVGDRDLVRPALEKLGVDIAFWGVKVKPGKPTAVGRLPQAGNARILSVPGNPGSATTIFSIFGVPLLRALTGRPEPAARRTLMRVLGAHHRNRPVREEYLRAKLVLHDGELCAQLLTNQSSGAVTSFADADALAVLASGQSSVGSGDRLPVIQLDHLWW